MPDPFDPPPSLLDRLSIPSVLLLFAAGAAGLAVWQFDRLSALERGGDPVESTRLFAFLYEIGGKWAVVVPFGLLSALLLWMAGYMILWTVIKPPTRSTGA